MMHYLGGISGAGVLKFGEETVGRADYDIDGYLIKPGQVSGCGEIRTSPKALEEAFGRKGLQLLTDDGRRLRLQFSEKRLRSASEAAHVDVTGDLPAASEWRH
jgi:hypothetical protein